MAEDVKYVPKGEPGKTCADCKFFEADKGNPAMGKCYGHDVMAEGSCNMFVSK